MSTISAAALRARFATSDEFAVIDPREEALFARGHLLAAANVPFSRMELLIGYAVPHRASEVVLCDDCDGTGQRAAHLLGRLGYENVRLLEGGNAAWAADGGVLFSGLNVQGRAFAEYVAWLHGTPAISARALSERLEREEPSQLIDCRGPADQAAASLPGAFGCPLGELLLRAEEPRDDQMLVVAHCGGRARGIIGAQTLIEAGYTCRVVSLENGTVAWTLGGLAVERGADRQLAFPDARRLRGARMKAMAIASRHSAAVVDRNRLKAWLDHPQRTIYVYDVRTREEFDQGHHPAARWVPGGDLIYEADFHLATRNARIVLIDTEGVRAPWAASWLRRMGFGEVYSYTAAPDELRTDAEAEPAQEDGIPRIDADALQDEVAVGLVAIVDLRRSAAYRRGHVAGAWLLTRENLYRDLPALPSGSLALVADDLDYARLVAADLKRLGRQVSLLEGGMTAWLAAHGAIERGLTRLASPPHDVHPGPGDFDNRRVAQREARNVLHREVGLVDQLEGDPAAPYADPDFST